jgi:hypothetical protein
MNVVTGRLRLNPPLMVSASGFVPSFRRLRNTLNWMAKHFSLRAPL